MHRLLAALPPLLLLGSMACAGHDAAGSGARGTTYPSETGQDRTQLLATVQPER